MVGDKNAIAEAALGALQANGARPSDTADIVIVPLPPAPDEAVNPASVLAEVRAAATCMDGQPDGGRVVFLLSGAAGTPMLRHPQYSVQIAAAMAAVRGLAMALGPSVLLNAVGVGTIGDPLSLVTPRCSRMPQSGTIDEIVDTVLLFCDRSIHTRPDSCSVDGGCGWSAGYGRSLISAALV